MLTLSDNDHLRAVSGKNKMELTLGTSTKQQEIPPVPPVTVLGDHVWNSALSQYCGISPGHHASRRESRFRPIPKRSESRLQQS